ncbi:hypothetical protein [Streptomyces sp. NPDC020298]|uniref:hypothetical protein n=1 Tax=unclassified Streptomyces TaxID=2593676 RepID=UPI0033EAAC02
MALTRPGPRGERSLTAAAPCGSGRPPSTHADAEVPPPVGVALRAMRMEALLGDPRDPANPYGQPALWLAGSGALPAAPAEVRTGLGREARGGAAAGEAPAPDQLARVLRPLFRRDLALGHAWGVEPLGSLPQGHRLAALLGPAALIAATGGVLRTVTRIVDGLARHQSAAGQWRPVLAAAFADLLACESLTTVALRSLAVRAERDGVPSASDGAEGPGSGGVDGLVAAVGYVVPQLAGELLDDLELVLNECGFRAGSPERRTLAKLAGDRAGAQVDWAGAAFWQARIVCGLGEWTDPSGHGEHPALRGLFRLGDVGPVVAAPGADDCHGAVAATLTGAAARLAGAGDPVTGALARVARRLVTEQRALRVACGPAASYDPADPAARALADRHALLLLAAAVLGVREAAAAENGRFLGDPDWALLALGRITERLGAPLPGPTVDPHPGVWAEIAGRSGHGVDCDVYATKLLW